MQRHTRIRIQDAADFIREEGGCNDIIALGLQKIVEALNDEMDDEELMIPDDSDDIVVDGPEPKEEQGTRKEKGGRENRKPPNPSLRILPAPTCLTGPSRPAARARPAFPR